MANWNKLNGRGNVEDRRGVSAKGLGIGGIILAIGLTYLTGGDVLSTLLQIGTEELAGPKLTQEERLSFEGNDEYENFAGAVLGSLDSYWSGINENYIPPTLVLFRERTSSSCGGASALSGPHYCPTDQTIYLDETFFEELTTKFGARGGDVAEAYVIGHEVGHHVQNLAGDLSGQRTNEASVSVELTADCYAGAWAGSIADDGVFEPGEVFEALDAAAAVGDDNIQERTTGSVNPDSFTHGSSQERQDYFSRGFSNPNNPEVCE